MPSLEFQHAYRYDSVQTGINVPVSITASGLTVRFIARVDTGASACLFERALGEKLAFDIESGEPQSFGTAIGRVRAFGHTVSIETLGLRFESVVYFFEDTAIQRNLLGRAGWLDRVRLGIVDHDSLLLVASYDFDSNCREQ